MNVLEEQLINYFPEDWQFDSLFIGVSELNLERLIVVKYLQGVYIFPMKNESEWTITSIRLIDLEQASYKLDVSFLKSTLSFYEKETNILIERLIFKNSERPYVKKQRERLKAHFI